MSLPKFLRHWMAKTLVRHSEEGIGTIRDYANGEWTEVHSWVDEKGADQGIEIIDNMLNAGRDAIYLITFVVGPGRGIFMVVDSNRVYRERGFWQGLYDVKEAFIDTREYCRAVADEMGFRRHDDVS